MDVLICKENQTQQQQQINKGTNKQTKNTHTKQRKAEKETERKERESMRKQTIKNQDNETRKKQNKKKNNDSFDDADREETDLLCVRTRQTRIAKSERKEAKMEVEAIVFQSTQ